MTGILLFLKGCGRQISRGNKAYFIWLAALFLAISIGLVAYANQYALGRPAPRTGNQGFVGTPVAPGK